MMVCVRQGGDGNWYLNRRMNGAQAHGRNPQNQVFRNWYFVKYGGNKKKAYITIGNLGVGVPVGFVGKRVRFKLEVME